MNEIFDKIGKTITEASQAVGERTKFVTDIAKLNCRISTLEHSLLQSYAELGKEYFANNKDNPAENVAELVNEIKAAIETIAEMKAQLLSIRGVVACQECGAENSIDNNFCGKCGAKLEKPEPPVEEEKTDEEVTEVTEIEEDKKED